MKQGNSTYLSGSWKANNRSTCQDISGMFYSQKYHYVSESLPLIYVESYINIDSILISHIFNSLHDMYRLDQLQVVTLKSPEWKRSARRTIDYNRMLVNRCLQVLPVFRASNELSYEILLMFFADHIWKVLSDYPCDRI
jgi:hypothetical protein